MPADAALTVEEARTPEAIAACLQIRRVVFVEEQGVPEAEEIDGLDPICRHYLARLGGEPVGAARTKPLDAAVKAQRVAVLGAARGAGVGAALMRRILADAAAVGPATEVVLDSQTSAIAFYERLGFTAEGPEFLDAGIPHRFMRRRAGDG